jgi:hypothetical protein
MKKLILCVAIAVFSFSSCQKDNVPPPCCVAPKVETSCIQTKIDAMTAANKDFTSVKRYKKSNEFFWLFDNGAAFDAPQYMLNAACDTVCTWCFCPNRPPCQQNFNLNDSTAIVMWKK